MRGALGSGLGSYSWSRIIPADAGSTWGVSSYSERCEDHPRGCGEHYPKLVITLGKLGSSPRMRGAPHHVIGSVL